MREVVIKTGARLHFGLFSLSAGREFGGVGMMVDSPGVHVRVEAAKTTTIIAPDLVAGRVGKFVSRFFEAYPGTPSAIVEVTRFIPPHHGLGSGTQLALAIGTGLARLGGCERSATDIARATGRGLRSTVGIHGFEHGGFVVDGGHLPGEDAGSIVRRLAIPAEWRFVLLTPTDGLGLSGESEVAAFKQLPRMPEAMTAELRERAVNGIVPALEQADFDGFAEALSRFGLRIGEFFAPVQGGVFRSPQAAALAPVLENAGFHSIVQSSWGPTVCVLARNEAEATRAAALAGRMPTRITSGARAGHSVE